jgi:hypothetical protein
MHLRINLGSIDNQMFAFYSLSVEHTAELRDTR